MSTCWSHVSARGRVTEDDFLLDVAREARGLIVFKFTFSQFEYDEVFV